MKLNFSRYVRKHVRISSHLINFVDKLHAFRCRLVSRNTEVDPDLVVFILTGFSRSYCVTSRVCALPSRRVRQTDRRRRRRRCPPPACLPCRPSPCTYNLNKGGVKMSPCTYNLNKDRVKMSPCTYNLKVRTESKCHLALKT